MLIPRPRRFGKTLGLLVGLNDRYEVKSNRESGFGRYDVMLIPKQPETAGRDTVVAPLAVSANKGVIIEFKKARHGETLREAAAAALRQIEEKRYAAELEQRGIRDVVKLAIAFAGKEVLVAQGRNREAKTILMMRRCRIKTPRRGAK